MSKKSVKKEEKKQHSKKTQKRQLLPSQLVSFSKVFHQDPKNRLARNAVTHTKLRHVLLNRDHTQNIKHVFTHKIEKTPDVSDQHNSGRCWMFAFLNTIRGDMIRKYHLEDEFDFSQTYLYFFDLLEKSHFFLCTIMDTCHHKLDSELLRYLLHEPVSDGGQWNMFVNVVEKYGLLPKCEMEETYQSKRSHQLNQILNQRLRYYACQIRSTPSEERLEEYMAEVYRLLVIFLGDPPTTFEWEYYTTKSKKKGAKRKPKKKYYDLLNNIRSHY